MLYLRPLKILQYYSLKLHPRRFIYTILNSTLTTKCYLKSHLVSYSPWNQVGDKVQALNIQMDILPPPPPTCCVTNPAKCHLEHYKYLPIPKPNSFTISPLLLSPEKALLSHENEHRRPAKGSPMAGLSCAGCHSNAWWGSQKLVTTFSLIDICSYH
jgi:hypothetical protein